MPHEFAGVILASPLPLDAKPAATARKTESQPALVIHRGSRKSPPVRGIQAAASCASWRRCPWTQPGIEHSDADYKLVAKFDPFQVQGFRLVMEKHMRARSPAPRRPHGSPGMRSFPPATIIPAADRPVTIGTISVEQPRGAPRDIAPSRFVDRGQAWSDASEDFVFETAMIGWNLLLNGTDNIGGLNSRLVLDLAETNSWRRPERRAR